MSWTGHGSARVSQGGERRGRLEDGSAAHGPTCGPNPPVERTGRCRRRVSSRGSVVRLSGGRDPRVRCLLCQLESRTDRGGVK